MNLGKVNIYLSGQNRQRKSDTLSCLSVFTVCMSCSIDSTTEKGLQLPIIHQRLTISKKMKENVAAEKEMLYDFWERCYQTFTAIIENIFFTHLGYLIHYH